MVRSITDPLTTLPLIRRLRRAARGPAVVAVEVMLLDVVDDRVRDEIPHAHLASQKQTDLGAADIVLDQLLDDVDVVLPRLQARQGFVDVGPAAFHDE